MNVTRIEATFRVTTPMFCGGAEKPSPKARDRAHARQGPRAELRAASFKGVLRFWWRACAWSHFDIHPEGARLRKIRQEEALLFGSPDTGTSRVRIRLTHDDNLETLQPRSELRINGRLAGSGAGYLGYGPISGERLTRECLASPFNMRVELRARDLTDVQRSLLVDAVRALGIFGGMGARSRRGYGSLSLSSLTGDLEPVNLSSLDQLRDAVKGFVRFSSGELPAYTALSSHSTHLVLRRSGADAMTMLDLLGEEYKAFRSATHQADNSLELVAHFGLPARSRHGSVKPVPYDRRGSPLMFHIHECDGELAAVVSFLPARFLPAGSEIEITSSRGSRRLVEPPGHGDLISGPVTQFLDRLRGPDGPFELVAEVRP
ncbi:MAG UNVERIFIED_CONTAM: type III-B CRISPR module RAMP protein Cmr1 [Thermobifida fusca]